MIAGNHPVFNTFADDKELTGLHGCCVLVFLKDIEGPLKNVKHLIFLIMGVPGYLVPFAAQLNSSEINTLSKSSDLIVTGKVTEQASSWNESKTRIYTQATIQVDEYIKGNGTGNTVTVKYLGGEVGEIGEKYSHMPRFEDKEEVLVFLKKDEKNADYKVLMARTEKSVSSTILKPGRRLRLQMFKSIPLKHKLKII